MARKKRAGKPLPTIWEVNDELWRIIQDVLDELDPTAPTGRPRTKQRDALNVSVRNFQSCRAW